MDNREAQFVLSAYRPGGQDAADPQFLKALAQVRRDPVLENWFNDSIAIDQAITEKLGAVAAPAGLRESILAGGKLSGPSRWARPMVRWAGAAALILAAIAGAFMLREAARPRLAGWQTQALSVISSLGRGESKFDFQAHAPAELVDWLVANRAPAAKEIPGTLAGLSSVGCKTFSWKGVPVSVICFARGHGGLVHLVVTNSTAPARTGTEHKPQLVKEGAWTTATWRSGESVYMIALEGSREELRPFLL